MEDGQLSLKWNNHRSTFTKAISLYRDQSLYSDVTLACNGQYFAVHKIILSSCSEYFQEILSMTQCKQPVIVLKDIRPVEVEQLLQYIYLGEVEVKQSELAELIKAAECLKIKGLATPDVEDEFPKNKKRKRQLSSDILESSIKKTKSSPSNIHSDLSLNIQSSQNTLNNLDKPKEFKTVKTEPGDADIIEEIDIKFVFHKLEENVRLDDDNNSIISTFDNNVEEEVPYPENDIQNGNFGLTNPGTTADYLPEFECEAVSSEDSPFHSSSILDESKPNYNSTPSKIETSKCGVRTKTGQLKIHYCTSCQFSSPYKSTFSRHVMLHTGEKPFKCQYCDYCTTTKRAVQIHERIHTGEKPYACNQCSYRSAHKCGLHNHKKSKH